MKFDDSSRWTSGNLIYREAPIYRNLYVQLPWPSPAAVNFSRAASATPQKYRVSGETRTVKTPCPRSRPVLFSLFSCNGQPVIVLVSAETARRLIARKSSARSAEFTADMRFFRRFVGNRAASRSVEPSLSWKFVRPAPRGDYEIWPRWREDNGGKKKGLKKSYKRVRNSGRKCIGWRKWVCSRASSGLLLALVALRKCCRSSARTALRFSVQRTIVALHPRE